MQGTFHEEKSSERQSKSHVRAASHFWVTKMHCKLQNAVRLGRALEEVKSITTNDLNSLNGRQNEHTRANSFFFRRDIGNELCKALMSGFSPVLSRFEAICNWNAKIRKFIKKNFLSVPIVRVFFAVGLVEPRLEVQMVNEQFETC